MQEMDVNWGFDFPVPHFTTVRLWLLRLGHYNLHRPKEQAYDWVWIIDHSNQIGQEKCLVILGVRVSQLPPPGEDFPLRLAQMEPIELEPVTVSDKEVVYRQLEANVAKTGVPRAIINDHGGDLAGGVELFRQAASGDASRFTTSAQGRMPAQSATGSTTNSGRRSRRRRVKPSARSNKRNGRFWSRPASGRRRAT